LADAPRQREALSMMLGQIERLDRLLTRLLSLTERDPPRRQRTSVRTMIEACAREHWELAQAKGITIDTLIELEQATVDAEQIRRALDNLMLNAIEAAPTRTTIRLRAQLQGEYLKLTVHDEGAGPPPEIRDHLFEPFVTGRAEGTGLGLSMVREIANAHGGSACLAPSASGTTFEILLPWR
jgi:signal transduction histidine kinase